MLMGLQNSTSGEISLGEHRVIPNYFEQNQVNIFVSKLASSTILWSASKVSGCLLGSSNSTDDFDCWDVVQEVSCVVSNCNELCRLPFSIPETGVEVQKL